MNMFENSKYNFFKNASWIFLGRMFQLTLTFITTFLVSRYLGPTKYGTITLAYSYVSLFLPLCTLGMNDIVVKELLDNKEKNDEILGSIFGLRFISSLFSIGLIYFFVNLVKNDPIFLYVTFIQSLSLLFQIFDTLMYYYQSKMLSKKSSLVYIFSYILTAFFRIICLIMRKDLQWFAFAVSMDYLIVSLSLLVLFFKDGNKLVFSLKTSKRLLLRSLPYLFSNAMIVIYSRTDTIIIGNIIGETEVGYYSAATTLCNAWPFLLTAIIDSASPIIIDCYSKNKIEYYRKIKKLYALIFYISIFAATLIALLSNIIISTIYGSEYIQAASPLRIVCWSTAFSYLGVARTIWMQCENKLKYEAVLSLFGAVVNVLLNVILIKNYGIIGAALSLLITQFLTNIVLVYIIKDTRENVKLIFDAIILKLK